MLRRYAAGSKFGSGGPGKVMSAMEGEVKEGLRAFRGGDFKELALFARLLESPLVDILLALLRLKRPILLLRQSS